MSEKVLNLTGSIILPLLSGVLVLKEQRGSLNDIKETGFYEILQNAHTDLPKGAYRYGVLLVLSTKEFGIQIYIPHQKTNAYYLYVRRAYKGVWTTWNSIATTEMEES
ncbi:MAG: hypothetical protein HFJ95_01640 [Muribaculaceae bacterium]|nr:hypothetical protein [Muribaculaceae bacterium]